MRPDLRGFGGKRVLVTGHTGFKGAWLSEWILGLGAQVHGLSLSSPTQPALFNQLELASRMNHRIGDIRDSAEMAKTVREAQPFHLGAQSLVRRSYLSFAKQLHSVLIRQAPGILRELCTAFNFEPVESALGMVGELVFEVLEHASGKWEECSNCTAHHEARLLPLGTDRALRWMPCFTFAEETARTVSWHQAYPEEAWETTQRHFEDYNTKFYP